MATQQEVKHSEAKAFVAQQKPRNAQGQFLSGEELVQYQQQQQASMLDQQRQALDVKLGRQSNLGPGTPVPIQSNMPPQLQQNNFQQILAANKPGARTPNGLPGVETQDTEADKWDVLLGKRRSNIRW